MWITLILSSFYSFIRDYLTSQWFNILLHLKKKQTRHWYMVQWRTINHRSYFINFLEVFSKFTCISVHIPKSTQLKTKMNFVNSAPCQISKAEWCSDCWQLGSLLLINTLITWFKARSNVLVTMEHDRRFFMFWRLEQDLLSW